MLIKFFCHTTHFHHLTNTVLMCYACCSRSCILQCSYTISSTQCWYGVVALQGSLLRCAPSSFHQHNVSCLTSSIIILITETGLCDVCIRHVKSKWKVQVMIQSSQYLSFIHQWISINETFLVEGGGKLPLHTVSIAPILCSWYCAIFIAVIQILKI